MANSIKTCPECSGALGKGAKLPKNNTSGVILCQECYDNLGLCTICEDTIHLDDCETFNDELYCETCFLENYYHCENCDGVEHVDDRYSSEYGSSYCESCYYELFMTCPRCDYEILQEDSCYDGSRDEYMCSSCYEQQGSSVDLDSHRNYHIEPPVEGDTFSTNRFERAVGVEIETIGYTADDIRDNFSAFRVSCDGSIDNDQDEEGFEFISNPMRGDHLFHEIDKIGNYLLENDFRVNRSCGLHVHIDARDLFYKELKGISMVMKSFEQVVFSMMPKSRYSSHWCKNMAIDKKTIREINSNKEFIRSWYWACEHSPSMDKYNDARYHGLNLHARVYLGTIEFRYHSGTNNPVKIKNWITICQSIVEKGIELGKVMDEVPENWDSKTHKLMTENELGLADFIEILELSSISQYIIERIRKFNRYSTENDRQYVTNNFTNSTSSV